MSIIKVNRNKKPETPFRFQLPPDKLESTTAKSPYIGRKVGLKSGSGIPKPIKNFFSREVKVIGELSGQLPDGSKIKMFEVINGKGIRQWCNAKIVRLPFEEKVRVFIRILSNTFSHLRK